jgi:hypothetical protein
MFSSAAWIMWTMGVMRRDMVIKESNACRARLIQIEWLGHFSEVIELCISGNPDHSRKTEKGVIWLDLR